MSRKGVEEAIKGGGCPDPRGLEDGRHEGFERRRVGVKKADGVQSRCVCVCASGAPVESKWP